MKKHIPHVGNLCENCQGHLYTRGVERYQMDIKGAVAVKFMFTDLTKILIYDL